MITVEELSEFIIKAVEYTDLKFNAIDKQFVKINEIINEAMIYTLGAVEQNTMEIDFLEGSLLDIIDLIKTSFYHSYGNTVLIVILICITIWRWNK